MSARSEDKLCHKESGGAVKWAANSTLSWYYVFCLHIIKYSYFTFIVSLYEYIGLFSIAQYKQ